MPAPTAPTTVADLETLLAEWEPVRKIDAIHVHTMPFARAVDFRGRDSIEAMRVHHRTLGLADIAQHLTIGPDGLIWTGRPFDARPVSVATLNGTDKRGPLMIAVITTPQDNRQTVTQVQEHALQATCRAVLAKFELKADVIRLRSELDGPGGATSRKTAGIKPGELRTAVGALLASNTLSDFDITIPRHLESPDGTRAMVATTALRREPDYLGVPDSDQARAEQQLLSDLIARDLLQPDTGDDSRDIDEEFRDLVGHVINTSQGILSGKGAMRNTTADLDILIRHHLAPQVASGKFQHLMFHAHGGLVSEKSALKYARAMLPWWKSRGVYPIFFVWESSLFQSVWRRPRGARGLDDVWDKGVEVATQALARPIWAAMKANARSCSAPMTDHGQPGGLYEFIERLSAWIVSAKPTLGLHAVGHSTGPILLTRFMQRMVDKGHTFDTLSYLAPAIRTDDFLREVFPLIQNANDRKIGKLRVFTMNEKAERDDDVAKLYRKSLLYYVRNACEDKTNGRLVGLQSDLFDDATMRSIFKLTSPEELRAPTAYPPATVTAIEFSQHADDRDQNPKTNAREHGAFDNDPTTMQSVLETILGGPVTNRADLARFPSKRDFEALADPDDATRSAAFVGEADDHHCCCCRCDESNRTTTGSAFDDYTDDDDDDGSAAAHAGGSTPPSGTPPTVLRRLGVCIGIDKYSQKPLQGCVNDSREWQALLEKSGFRITSLHDGQATRAAILGALEQLIAESRSGDELVFQYAGHGTQVPDLDGDEIDPYDEALVPFDFDDGALLTDDDIYRACEPLRSRPGVTLTVFMDCCNSGSNTRAAIAPNAAGSRVRYLTMTAPVIAKYRKQRAGMTTRALARGSERDPLPGVVSFAACLDHELAYETDKRGDFTRIAATVFDETLRRGESNQAFISKVLKAFGANRRQNPIMLDPAPGLKARRFLGGSR